MNARPVLHAEAERAALHEPSQPFVTGDELEQVIALANQAMREDIEGVTLRMHSPHDLDAEPDDRVLLSPGVRRLVLAIDRPSGLLRPVDDPQTLRLVFHMYVIGNGPNLQLDSERVLQWVARVEAAAAPADDAARDLANPATVRGLARDRPSSREVSDALASASREQNMVADEVRAAVGSPANWSQILDTDTVVATASLHRSRGPAA